MSDNQPDFLGGTGDMFDVSPGEQRHYHQAPAGVPLIEQTGEDVVFRIKRVDPHDGRPKDLGTFPSTLSADALIRRLGKPGAYRIQPLDLSGHVVGAEITLDVDPDHIALQGVRPSPSGGQLHTGGGGDAGMMQAMLQTMLTPLLAQLAAEKETLAKREERLAAEARDVAETRTALMTLASDASNDAASKQADAAAERMRQQQDQYGSAMAGIMDAADRRHQQHIETLQANQAALLAQMSGLQERESERMASFNSLAQGLMGQQQQLMVSNMTTTLEQAKATMAEERSRLERESDRNAKTLEREEQRRMEHNQVLLSLREQQISAQGLGGIEQILELKRALSELNDGGGEDKSTISQIIDGVKEIAKAGGEFAKMSAVGAAAQVGVGEYMEEEEEEDAPPQVQRAPQQQQAPPEQRTWAQTQGVQAQAPAQIEPPDPFSELRAGAPAQAQAQNAAAQPVAAAPVDFHARAVQRQHAPAPAQQQQQQQQQLTPEQIESVKTARAAFRWAVDQMRSQSPSEWETTIMGVIQPYHSHIVPYIQAVSVTRALVEAGAPGRMAGQVVAGLKSNQMLRAALSEHYNLQPEQLRWEA